MRVMQEDTVRQMHLRHGIREIHVKKDTLITQQAKEYIRDKGLILLIDDEPLENREIHPPAQSRKGQYLTEEGRVLPKKPEHMTHLHANVLVNKNHPLIALRGKIDSLEAAIVRMQYQAWQKRQQQIVDELDEVLLFCRNLLACEVTGKPLLQTTLLGLDESQQREVSHNPQKYYGIGHLLPNYRLDAWCIGLNLLRTQARETELAAAAALIDQRGRIKREDILQGLNRLSSVFYIMMCRSASGIYEEAGEQGNE